MQTSSPINQKKNAQLQKFPCDGVPRYDVGKGPSMKNLPYGKAYDAIFKQECCRDNGNSISYTTGGMRRLLILNEAYCGHAQEFLVTNRDRQKKQLDDWATEIKAAKEKYLANEEEISRLLDLRHRDMATAEDEARLVELDQAQEASPFVRDTEGTLIVRPEAGVIRKQGGNIIGVDLGTGPDVTTAMTIEQGEMEARKMLAQKVANDPELDALIDKAMDKFPPFSEAERVKGAPAITCAICRGVFAEEDTCRIADQPVCHKCAV